jgi:hypothetical protein
LTAFSAFLLQDEQLHWEEQVAEGQRQLNAAQSALRAFEGRVACAEGQLQAEQERRQAAEQELHQIRGEQQRLMAECAQQRAELEGLMQQQVAGGRVVAGSQPGAAAAVPSEAASSGAASGNLASTDAVLLHHMLLLRQEVAALKLGSVRNQEATLPPCSAAAMRCQEALPKAVAAGWPHAMQQQSHPLGAFTIPDAESEAVWDLRAMQLAQAPNCSTTGRITNPTPQHQARYHTPQPQAARWHGSQQQPANTSAAGNFPAAQLHNKQQQQEHAARWEQRMGTAPSRRRQLHEPRQPADPARPASSNGKRRQMQQGQQSRWDYRPAWNELGSRHLRVDDSPASAAVQACQVRPRQVPAMTAAC